MGKLHLISDNYEFYYNSLVSAGFVEVAEKIKNFQYEEASFEILTNIEKFKDIFEYDNDDVNHLKNIPSMMLMNSIQIMLEKNGLILNRALINKLEKIIITTEIPVDNNGIIISTLFKLMLNELVTNNLTFEDSFNSIRVKYKIQLTTVNKNILNNLIKNDNVLSTQKEFKKYIIN